MTSIPRPRPRSAAAPNDSLLSPAVSTSSLAGSDASASSSAESAKKRAQARDEALRRRVEKENNSRKSGARATIAGNRLHNDVAHLRPGSAYTVPESATVVEAAKVMVQHKIDCLLVVDDAQHLRGIMTDKDLAFRVVAEGINPRTTKVTAIMTPKPISVTPKSSATDAVMTMAEGHFRHLPVCSEQGIVGVLDITRSLYEAIDRLDRAYDSSKKLQEAVKIMEREWGANPAREVVGLITNVVQQKLGCPPVQTIIENDGPVPEVSGNTTVREAVIAMKRSRETAAIITEKSRVTGIFTSKDVVRRVLAAELDPEVTSVLRVMTPHPDSILPETSVLDALKMMHEKHYLHLPVIAADQRMVGLIDVLKLTYSIINQGGNAARLSTQCILKPVDPLHQLRSLENGGESGPMWQQFWNGSLQSQDIDQMSDSDTQSQDNYPTPSRQNSFAKAPSTVADDNDSASVTGQDSDNFIFKLKDDSGHVHRFSSRIDSLSQLQLELENRVGRSAGLRYLDNEDDWVKLETDRDLVEAVLMARSANWARLVLAVDAAPGSAVAASSAFETPVKTNTSANNNNNNNNNNSNSESYSPSPAAESQSPRRAASPSRASSLLSAESPAARSLSLAPSQSQPSQTESAAKGLSVPFVPNADGNVVVPVWALAGAGAAVVGVLLFALLRSSK